MTPFEEVLRKFQIKGEVTEVVPFDQGAVNHTFAITCGGVRYILQEMNRVVYKYPTEVMNNLFLVTEYLRGVIAGEGHDPNRETLTFLRTASGNQILQTDSGRYFRLYRMIEDGEAMDKPATPEAAGEMGRIVGQFQRRLVDFPVNQLSRPLPALHNMHKVTRTFLDAVRADICFRSADCQEQIRFVLDRAETVNGIHDALESGEIPLRVTHNDPHYRNILVEPDTGRAFCLIDLDTVMPGASIQDFGDAARIGAATVGEDGTSGDVELDLDFYRAILAGYAGEMGPMLTPREWDLIPYAVYLAALERGICNLTDYLNGDHSTDDFSDERLSLYRAVNQFYLALDIEEKERPMNAIAEEIRASV